MSLLNYNNNDNSPYVPGVLKKPGVYWRPGVY